MWLLAVAPDVANLNELVDDLLEAPTSSSIDEVADMFQSFNIARMQANDDSFYSFYHLLRHGGLAAEDVANHSGRYGTPSADKSTADLTYTLGRTLCTCLLYTSPSPRDS